MEKRFLELEEIIDDQINIYSKIEKCVMDKKEVLVKGDIDSLRMLDQKIETYISKIEKLENKRQSVYSNLGKSDSTLREIIDSVSDDKKSQNLGIKLDSLRETIMNIKKYNDMNAQLIKHSLKLIEHSVFSIANVLMPESSTYNNYGRVKSSSKNLNMTISSVNQEA